MSADLLAAFGDPVLDTAAKQAKLSVDAELSAAPQEQPWILQSRTYITERKPRQDEPLWKQDNQGADVLFDASDDPDEDDFGDFEAPPSEAVSAVKLTQTPNQSDDIDLLGLEDVPPTVSLQPEAVTRPVGYPEGSRRAQVAPQPRFGQHHRQKSTDLAWDNISSPVSKLSVQEVPSQLTMSENDDWGNFEDAQIETEASRPEGSPGREPAQLKEPKDLSPPEAEDDDWDDFEDDQVDDTRKTQTTSNSSITAIPALSPSTDSVVAGSSAETQTQVQSHDRPSNIPPPSTLLQLLPQVYKDLRQQSRLPSPPSSLALSVQKIYKTSARIMSGRAHRWKRDTRLAQSTRISQAGVKSSGMKLTALDRGESIKEDQEAAEVVAAWQRHAADLNAVMVRAKVQKPPVGLSAKGMAVRGASGTGVMSARECCAVCGLKRNERVTGIDVNVEDTFGEFWVEFWGHRDCYEFWYEYEGLLKQR